MARPCAQASRSAAACHPGPTIAAATRPPLTPRKETTASERYQRRFSTSGSKASGQEEERVDRGAEDERDRDRRRQVGDGEADADQDQAHHHVVEVDLADPLRSDDADPAQAAPGSPGAGPSPSRAGRRSPARRGRSGPPSPSAQSSGTSAPSGLKGRRRTSAQPSTAPLELLGDLARVLPGGPDEHGRPGPRDRRARARRAPRPSRRAPSSAGRAHAGAAGGSRRRGRRRSARDRHAAGRARGARRRRRWRRRRRAGSPPGSPHGRSSVETSSAGITATPSSAAGRVEASAAGAPPSPAPQITKPP